MQNVYDDDAFFAKYGEMARSREGLTAAGEWEALRGILPGLAGKRVLDLGCGYGWHCLYAVDHGASEAVGVDVSEKMLAVAREKSQGRPIRYLRGTIEDFAFEDASFDLVLSSLALHYVASFDAVAKKAHAWLTRNGDFVFSVEHPVFTASGPQQWACDARGNRLHWPVDRYFSEGERDAEFLGCAVKKYHRTVTAYVQGLFNSGFTLTALVEPEPSPELLRTMPEMADELRRPMMLLVAARKL